jgi:hypothetical protein
MEQLPNRRIKNASNKPTGNKDRGPPSNLAVNFNKYPLLHILHPNPPWNKKYQRHRSAHLQSSKTNGGGSFLDPELPVFVKVIEFYHVGQSL